VKEILERVLRELPGYLPDLAALASRPKTTIARLLDAGGGDLTRPLVFVAVSVGIGFLLQLPMLGREHDFATLVAGMAVVKVLALLGFAAVIHGCFLAVRGAAPFATTFAAYLYVVSPLYLALVVLEIASVGVLRAHDPALAAAARIDPAYLFDRPARFDALAEAAPGPAWSYVALRLTAVGTILGWFVACWGALRRAHGVARGRAALAGLGTLVAAYPFFGGLSFVLLGMFGTAVPALR
jgi:hypothetical protein